MLHQIAHQAYVSADGESYQFVFFLNIEKTASRFEVPFFAGLIAFTAVKGRLEQNCVIMAIVDYMLVYFSSTDQ